MRGQHRRWIFGAAMTIAAFVMLANSVSSPAETPGSYVLGPGDVLSITVLGESDLTRTITVGSDGTIALPLVGEIFVTGLTAQQTADALTAGLRVYLRNPIVTIAVTTPRATFVYLLGAGFGAPGAYEFRAGWTLMEAVARAGSVVPRAALKRAALTRQGEPKPIPLDLERLLRGDQTANLPLQPGDIIVVPLQETRVLILGMVHAPGVVEVDEGTRLLDVVLRAGGPTDHAALDEVAVIRQEADGTLHRTRVNLLKVLQQDDPSQNIQVQDMDIVIVPEVNRVDWRDVLAWVTGLRLLLGPSFLLLSPGP